MLLAQSVFELLADDAITSFSPYAALGANGALIGLACWLITQWMPKIIIEERISREKIMAEERASREKTTGEFTAALEEHRKQSRDIALNGHQTVDRMSVRLENSFHELAIALTELGVEGLSRSGVLRRQSHNKESIHE